MSKESNRRYWEQRALSRERQAMASAEEFITLLESFYRDAQEAIAKNIENFYIRYMGKYGVSYAEAVKRLTPSERATWLLEIKRRLDEIERGIDVAENYAALDAGSYGARITRLQARSIEIDAEIAKLTQRFDRGLKGALGSIAQDAFLQTTHEIQTRTHTGFVFRQLDTRTIENLLSYPWSGANFSQRIWRNANALRFSLRETLTNGIIRGEGIDKMMSNLNAHFDVARSAARRIVRTETNYVLNQSRLQSFAEMGVEKYQFLATLDDRTSETCIDLDLNEYLVSEAKVGENYPPMHPNCRSVTIPVIEGASPSERTAKDKNGKTYYVPGDMPYKEWERKYVLAA